MVLVEAVFVLGVLAVVLWAVLRLGLRVPESHDPPRTVEWRVEHYDRDGQTRVVLRSTAHERSRPRDEHVIAQIPIDDRDYDALFIAAMATARERRALFEAEGD